MQYNELYNPHNIGTRFVFDHFYNILGHIGIKSDLVACCGKDFKTYEKYASIVCSSSSARAYFFENDPKRFEEIKKGITFKKVKVKLGNVFHYNDFEGPTCARIEDLGIGLGIRFMLSHATGRLYTQSRINGIRATMWKAQLLDSSIRAISDDEIVQLYQNYLFSAGLQIKTIDNKVIGTKKILNVIKKQPIIKYEEFNRGTCAVYEHKVELEKNNRQAKLFMFTCINGSRMLQSLLVYK